MDQWRQIQILEEELLWLESKKDDNEESSNESE